jgi:hypothetical protein
MPHQISSRNVVVALFERESSAREAVAAVRALGIGDQHVELLAPGQRLSASEPGSGNVSTFLAQAATAAESDEVDRALLRLGVPDGEARFYAQSSREGRYLVVVNANGRAEEVRQRVLALGGEDVESRGRDLIRPTESGVPGGAGAQPVDLTTEWRDVRSRYEMLWQQHYGTTDATWEQMEPLYEYAWQLANRPGLRGRPWSEAANAVQREWSGSRFAGGLAWQDAEGPLRDVWQDVAEEAATGAEGGADRRITRQGSDQSVAARDLEPPKRGAA